MTDENSFINPIRTNSGFSLIIALIAVAILVTISLAMAALMNSITSQTRHMNSTSGARALISTLQGFISYPSLCTANLDPSTHVFDLARATSNEGLPLSFQLGSPSQKVEADRELLNYDIVTEYLNYHSSPLPIAADPLIGGNKLYSGSLVIKLKKRGDGKVAGGNSMHEVGVGTLILSVNPLTNEISRCYALADAQQACEDIGGTYDPLNTPKCKLPYPCAGIPNSIFMGYVSGTVSCKTLNEIVGSTCPAGHFIVSNGAGGITCRAP